MLELIGRAKAAIDVNSFTLPTPIAGESFTTIANRLLNWVLVLAGLLAVIYLIYGGIMYITAGGDADKATKGRTAVINAIIGIIIILLAIVVVAWVDSLVKSGTP